MFIIYRALNLKTGRSYIGQTRRKLHQRIHSHTTQRSPNKFGVALIESSEKDWEWSVLSNAETVEEAQELECFYIAKYKAMTLGYNSPIGVAKYADESRKRMSESRKGRKPWNAGGKGVYSQETLLKMSMAKLGRKTNFTKEQIQKRVAASKMSCSKAIVNLETNETYPSVTQAAETLGVAKSTLTRILSGKRKYPTIKIAYATKE
jgi:group I intron endonuclease